MPSSATNPRTAIETRALEKHYGESPALAGIDLSVPSGICFGLLGPNGAGKSTCVGVLTTLLSPSAGSATLLGFDVVRERAEVRRRIGVVFQESALDPELSAREQLTLHARLFHLPSPRAVADDWLERMSLAEHADRPVRKLSGGLRRRVEIARGLLSSPGVLFLDEPTTGLDVAARARIWEELRALHRTGETTIFLTTHSMEEADALCDTLAILDGGRVAALGSPAGLKAELGGDVVTLLLERPDTARRALADHEGVARVESDPEREGVLRVTVVDGSRRLAALLDSVRDAGVLEVDLRRPSLEHVFLHHTGHRFEHEETPRMSAPLSDLVVLTGRELRRYARDRAYWVGQTIFPLVLIGIVGLGLNDEVELETGASYAGHLATGLLAMLVGSGAVGGGFALIEDRSSGFLRALLVAPVSRVHLVLAKLGARVIVSLVLVCGLGAVLALFTPLRVVDPLAGLVAVVGVTAIFVALGVSLAVPLRRLESFRLISALVTVPLYLCSGIFYTIASLPAPARWIAHVNPLTYGVDLLRHALLGVHEVPLALSTALLGLGTLASVAVAVVVFDRGTRG